MKKYIVNFLEDSNKTIVTRYLKENFLMKSKFFILLYSIYLIYVRIYIYKFNLDISFSNEYSYEINRIIEELSKNISAQDLAEKINEIFKNTYNELYEIEKNEEIKIARKILKVYNIEEGRGI